MRRKRLTIPVKKVMCVFPNPFNMLFNVVFKYKKGQIHARIVIKLPANALEKTNSPRNFPNIKKKIVQKAPKRMQKKKVFLMVLFSVVICPDACASETEGRSIKEIELVRAFGNRMNGSTIPVKIP